MSMYNMICGRNPVTHALLDALGFKEDDVPRLRDVYVRNKQISVLTRTGGNNRAVYEEANEFLRQNPFYVSDEDDDFDSTFAHFHFSFPPEYKELLDAHEDDELPMDKFKRMIGLMR